MAHGNEDYITDIDIASQIVGVYPQQEWSVLQGDDMTIVKTQANQAAGVGVSVSYDVPAGHILYITHVTWRCVATNNADADKPQHSRALAYNSTTGDYLMDSGGDGGGGIAFVSSLVIEGGNTFGLAVYNRSNHNCDISIQAKGYQI